jgi:tryptophan 2,3-dioxygenase
MAFGLPGDKGTPRVSYGTYLKIDQLLSLQQPLSDPAQHDELLFIIIHQVYELWFKELLHDLDGVVERLGRDEVLGAQRLIRRCIEVQRVLIQQVTVLETMTPNDFLRFRDHLRPASGFQSAQFRAIEILSGIRDPRQIRIHEEGSADRAELERRLATPSLGDAVYALLRRRGYDLPQDAEGDEGAAKRQRLLSLTRIYQELNQNYDLYLLLEALMEYDELFTLWRLHHVTMVERMIGSKPGTGGSEGVGYLRRTVDRKFFPEFWELRTYLSKETTE